jgi:hypothetical protein
MLLLPCTEPDSGVSLVRRDTQMYHGTLETPPITESSTTGSADRMGKILRRGYAPPVISI